MPAQILDGVGYMLFQDRDQDNHAHGTAVAPRASRGLKRRLAGEVAALLKSDALRKEFADKGIEPGALTPKEFGSFIKDESSRWTALAAKISLKRE